MKQVFQSQTSTRWNRFKWFSRIVIVFILVSVTSILLSIFGSSWKGNARLLISEKRVQNINIDSKKKKVSDKELISYAKHLKNIRKRKVKDLYLSTNNLPKEIKQYYPVRAGFYVNWDPDSYYSLQKNASKLNMVLPEWFFQKNAAGSIETRINARALATMRQNKMAIVPVLSNNLLEKFHGDSTLAILKNKDTRAKIIAHVKNLLLRNHFQGINIDLESLPSGSGKLITTFSAELYQALHPAGLLVTLDINPFDRNYELTKIAKYYDFIFIMAYDEHFVTGAPGCITSLQFIESSLDDAMKEVSSKKFVLCLGAYGYNWKAGEKGSDISYEDFVSLAVENKVPVQYDDDNSEVYLNYTDENNAKWEAHCSDATSVFNAMRTASDYDAAGVALWFLGGEDSRVWNFYDQDLSLATLNKKPFDFRKLERLHSMYSVAYDGKGEILDFESRPQDGFAKFIIDKDAQIVSHQDYQNLPVSYLIKRYKTISKKYIALTFDDGPDGTYTPEILDILKEKNVKASFFVIGVNAESNIPLLHRLYNEGHDVGNHTFTHPNLEISTDNRERVELRSTELLIESVLGRSTLLFRPPYNTDPEPKAFSEIRPLAIANEEGFLTVASSLDPNDWQKGITADSILARVKAQEGHGNVLLLHDSGGERSQTVEALPAIIDFFRSKGYQFVTVSQLIGVTRDQVMPKINKNKIITEKIDYLFLVLTFVGEHFLQGFFFVAITLGIFRLLFLFVLAMRTQYKFKKNKIIIDPNYKPKVTVIVPGYNEEMNAVNTIDNLLKSNYDHFNILFIDDGSKDNTYANVKAAYGEHPLVTVMTKANGGKASALNFGIAQADGDLLVCIDADTVLLPDAISQMVPFFMDEDVAAVAGNVRVGNTLNLLTNWQKIEYTTSQNFDRLAFDAVNAILVVPGAIGAFRKTCIDEIGGFTTDTLAEDCDITVRLLSEGYKIRTCSQAISLTEAPESLNMFVKQRFRWTFGMMQCFWKHRDLLFNTKLPNMGWILLPNLLIFGFIIPLFSPIVDLLFLQGIFTEHGAIYITFYLFYFLIDWIVAIIAYRFDKQKFGILQMFMLFIQRLVYRQILFVVLIKAYLKAIKGELASWGVLKRTGNVKID